MDFKEFANQMEQDIRKALDDKYPGAALRQAQIQKLQGESYMALSVTREGSNIGVNVNLNQFYEQIENGTPYGVVMDRALAQATDHLNTEPPNYDLSQISDYDRAKALLCVDVVGTAQNKEMLEKIPHTDIEDLTMVYRLQLDQDNSGAATILVTNELMEKYGITKEQLHADAMESAPLNRPAIMKTMRDILVEKMGMPEEMIPPEMTPPIYVVTNEMNLQGAASVFYPKMMEQAAKEMGGNYYILPSSVHEMLFVADDGNRNLSELKAMVAEVNENEVALKEQLTNSVYHYDAKERIFERGERFEARREAKLNEKESRASVIKDLQEKKMDTDIKPRSQPHHKKAEQLL